MGITQVAFDIPPAIQKGIDSGTLIRYGGVVRDQAGHIVKHLKEVKVVKSAENVQKAVPAVQESGNALGKIVQVAKKNKYLFIGAAAVAFVVGGITYVVMRNKKGEKVAVPKCVADFNSALMSYVDAIRKKKVTEAHIDNVLSALDQIKENQSKGYIEGDFSFENAELLIKMIRDYTIALAEANNYEITDDIEIRNDNIIDLQTYLNIQKKVFEESA